MHCVAVLDGTLCSDQVTVQICAIDTQWSLPCVECSGDGDVSSTVRFRLGRQKVVCVRTEYMCRLLVTRPSHTRCVRVTRTA